METEDSGKFRLRPVTGQIFAILASISVMAFGFGACGGDGSNGDSTLEPDEPGKQKGLFQTQPNEAGEGVPEGLDDEADQALIAILQADSDYSDYVALLQLSGVSEDLATRDGVTVFAPVDEAVRAQSGLLDRFLAPKDLKSVLADIQRGTIPKIKSPERLAQLLRRGIANGELVPGQLKPGLKLDPLEGAPLRLARGEEGFRVDGVEFESDEGTLAGNGVLYPSGGLIRP